MFERFLTVSLICMGLFTFIGYGMSCNHSANLERTYPKMTNKDLWLEEGIVGWPELPVRVSVSGMMSEALADDVRSASEMWNLRIGCEIFTFSEDPDADITVSMEPKPKDKDWIASFRYVGRGHGDVRKWGGKISVYRLDMFRLILRKHVMAHELGHALGLRDLYDDHDKGNVMHGKADSGEFVDPTAAIFLRQLYCDK